MTPGATYCILTAGKVEKESTIFTKGAISETAMVKNLDQLIHSLFDGFTQKQQKVLSDRFGLKNGKRSTLQEIGDELGVTRERVRQIEEQAMKKTKGRIEDTAGFFLDVAKEHLSRSGGVREDKLFVGEVLRRSGLAKGVKYPEEKARFVLLVAGTPLYHKEDDAFHAFWYSDRKAEKKFFDFVRQMTQFLKNIDRDALFREKAHMKQLPDVGAAHLLSIPKHFGMNVFGDFGLREWAEIEPRTIRDKAYLTLKKYGKPLHFEDIAKNIQRLGIDRKAAHVQTVHNELIKDKRFVLVGRGMYALSEHGYEPGTVRQVIARLLKKHGPMGSDDVVRLVNEQRFLKENTILLNLQNRKFFKRLDDGRYSVKEA